MYDIRFVPSHKSALVLILEMLNASEENNIRTMASKEHQGQRAAEDVGWGDEDDSGPCDH